MKDFLGAELAVGDTVAFPRPKYRELVRGTVKKITKCFVFIEYQVHWTENYFTEVKQDPCQVIRVPLAN